MKLSRMNALKAMATFLNKFYEKDKGEDLALILSDMSLDTFTDGGTADPAAWEDWIESIEKTNRNYENDYISEDAAYHAMIIFLQDFADRIKSKEIAKLLNTLRLEGNVHAKAHIWNEWLEICKTLGTTE